VAYALENPEALVDAEGNALTAAEWLSWAVNAPDREWHAAARAAGWDPRVRPSHGDLRAFGRGLQGAVLAEDFARDLERVRERGGML